MLREQLRSLMKVVRGLNAPAERKISPQDCIGFYDETQTFQFTTFGTSVDKERILKDLASNGANVVGVMTPEEATRLSRRQDISSPNSHPFRD